MNPTPPAQVLYTHRVRRHHPEKEGHLDHLDPVEAWEHLCHHPLLHLYHRHHLGEASSYLYWYLPNLYQVRDCAAETQYAS